MTPSSGTGNRNAPCTHQQFPASLDNEPHTICTHQLGSGFCIEDQHNRWCLGDSFSSAPPLSQAWDQLAWEVALVQLAWEVALVLELCWSEG